MNACDDRRRRQRIGRRLEVGLAQQVADAAVELAQLVVAEVLDHAHDVARRHRLVHRLGVDQRQLPGVDGREVGLGLDLAADALVDQLRAGGARSRPSGWRARWSACRAHRGTATWSSRTSERSARAISRSPTRSSIDVNDSSSRWMARSRQSPRILAMSLRHRAPGRPARRRSLSRSRVRSSSVRAGRARRPQPALIAPPLAPALASARNNGKLLYHAPFPGRQCEKTPSIRRKAPPRPFPDVCMTPGKGSAAPGRRARP